MNNLLLGIWSISPLAYEQTYFPSAQTWLHKPLLAVPFWNFFSSQGGLGPKGSVGRTPMIFTIQSNSISVLSHDVKPRCGHIHPMSHVRTKTRTWDKHVCHVPATINKFCSTQHNSASIPRKLFSTFFMEKNHRKCWVKI